MEYGDRYKEFEQYLASGEPGVEERARNWSMAIGLQDVDRLTPSEFLLEQAKANIEGRISTDELRYILTPKTSAVPAASTRPSASSKNANSANTANTAPAVSSSTPGTALTTTTNTSYSYA